MDGSVTIAAALRGCWPADTLDAGVAQRVADLVTDGLDRLRRIMVSGRVSL